MRRFFAGLLGLALVSSSAFADDSAIKPNTTSAETAVSATELQEMRELLRVQAKQLEEQRQMIEQEQRKLQELERRLGTHAASEQPRSTAPASAQAPDGPLVAATAAVPTQSAAMVAPAEKKPDYAPLHFRIGAANFTPGGFLDFPTVFRSTNLGSGVATSFGATPFSNTPQGHLTETRLSAQTSRIALKIDSDIAGNHVLGYLESDFTGNQPSSQYVTSNSSTMRMRMYMVDVRRDKWEVLGGQAWTMMTPSRKGLGVMPADLFLTQLADANYHVGLVWARQGQVRITYHPSDNWVMGVSVENPEQFIGSGTTVLLPAGLASTLSPQVDSGANTATPNVRPDIVAKIAHDARVGSHNWHLEAAGLLRSFKVVLPVATGYDQHSATGGGGSVNTIFEAFKNFNLIATTFWSDGGGRYTAALGPDMVVLPSGAPSLIHSGAGIAGFEWQASKDISFVGYYGATYFQRNAFLDTTNTTPGRYAGFGFTGSSVAANRAIQEATLGMTRTFWKNPNFGALQVISQFSYLTRAPWYVAPATPKNAHVTMGFVDVRYVLP